ncbi:hypothetical protein GZH47_24445 [Paenibacillus rhizovicinus]|uniref:Uncharacterized protein n=1 Tax=Paenibacillus rhizovicinus TaxID=2704463 RepID=A0A6C0P534_9BACL|nr:hypothetical protein [Paenibacillus rhizovicinus]QHW33638.1 hypothetical protein GZH47_24445 [Paenibacillus rhizovicinus]
MMRKRWLLAAALFTVLAAGSGTWLHATYAASDKTASTNTDSAAKAASDGDGEIADDQEESDGDGETNDDQGQAGQMDNDGETNDD